MLNLKSKLFAGAVGVAMVLSIMPVVASAQTTAELTAQINSLLAMIAQLQAQIAGTSGQVPLGSAAQGPAQLFNTDLTVGSKGSDVTALQMWLVSKGDLQMPAGVAYGYFGSLTKAALAKYQASAGISPAVGYCGPITRARLNAMVGTTGGTTGGTVVPGSITTPGAEGTITASESSASVVSTVYEGDVRVPVLGIKLEAKSSDMAFQRLKLDLDDTGTAATDVMVYNKIFKKLTLTDESGNVLTSIDLNSSTVVKDGTDYFITLSGFSYVIPKNTSKIVLVKADLYETIDTTDLVAATHSPTISVALNGVRAVDGAGIDQYSGTTAISATPVVSATLSDSATLAVSLNASSPKKQDVTCTSGTSENECDKLSVLVFDLKAEKDSVKITDMQIAIAKGDGRGAATASTTVRLYDGSTELAAATVGARNTAIFSNFDYTIAKDTTKTLTVKADIRAANTEYATFTSSASSTGITAENMVGNTVTPTGTATGYAIGIRSVGPEISLVSKSIVASLAPQNSSANTISTSTLSASFVFRVKAVGGDLALGLTQSTSSPFFSSTTPTQAVGGAKSFRIYVNGSEDVSVGSNATSTEFTVPTACVTFGTNSCTLAEGTSVDISASLMIQGRISTGAPLTPGLYSIGVRSLNWNNGQNSTFMDGESDWRTSSVSFP